MRTGKAHNTLNIRKHPARDLRMRTRSLRTSIGVVLGVYLMQKTSFEMKRNPDVQLMSP